jgi:hypothetical protein
MVRLERVWRYGRFAQLYQKGAVNERIGEVSWSGRGEKSDENSLLARPFEVWFNGLTYRMSVGGFTLLTPHCLYALL